MFLVWMQKHTNAKGEVYPSGSECYRCFDCRRRYFPKHSSAELKTTRGENRAVDDRFCELRLARVRGDDKYTMAQEVVVEELVAKRESMFDERYQEGTFFELYAYARKLGLDNALFEDKNKDELIQHLESRYKLKVTEDRDGTVGVEVVGEDAGQYRFKRGKKNEAAKEKKEDYKDNKEMRDERFDNLCDKLTAPQDVPAKTRAAAPRPRETESSTACSSEAGASTMSRHAPSVASHICAAKSAALNKRMESPPRGPVSDRHPLSGSKYVQAPTPMAQRHDDDWEEEMSGEDDKDEVKTPSDNKKTRRCSSDAVIDAARLALKKIETEMSWNAHWTSRVRKREFTSLCARLTAAGRKCGAFLTDSTAASLSQKCMDTVEKLEARQAVFDKLRNGFVDMVQADLDKPTVKIMHEAGAPELAGIITMLAQQLVGECLTVPVHVQVRPLLKHKKQQQKKHKQIINKKTNKNNKNTSSTKTKQKNETKKQHNKQNKQ